MKSVTVWINPLTGKFWHKDFETGVKTEITEVTPTTPPSEFKARMIAMGLRIR